MEFFSRHGFFAREPPAAHGGRFGVQRCQFNGRYRVDWGIQNAALSTTVLAPLIFYMIFQDKFVKGLTVGAVKG